MRMDKLNFTSLTDVSLPRRVPLIIAHRGACREAPENTLPALERALAIGADGVEIDVMLTGDRVPVLSHNDDLSRLTHYRGYLHQTPFATVHALDVGSHFSTATAGITMPTLTEALELLCRHEILTIIEIKAQPGLIASAAELIGGILADFRFRGGVMLSSSNVRLLMQLKKRHPQLARALIFKRRAFSFCRTRLFAKLTGFTALHPSVRTLTPGLVSHMRRRECAVHAWTANTPAELDRCMAMDVDGIITDDVPFARRYCRGNPD